LDYDELRRIHRLEKNSSTPVEVGREFFVDLRTFVEVQRGKYILNLKNGSVSGARDYNNLEQVVKEIMDIRERKVLNKALIASRTNEYSLKGLTNEEEKLFKSVFGLLQSFKSDINGVFEVKAGKGKSKEKGLKKLSLQILSEIPSFIGADMKEYGPFTEGQTVELTEKTAALLVSKKLAEKK